MEFKSIEVTRFYLDEQATKDKNIIILFSFDQAMKVEKTLMQTLACQLSCNSCSRLINQ